jgi:predicted nucleic acid-binding protein
MLVYLDNCCFNRPFDEQSNIRIKLETDAKLHVQFLIRAEKLGLAWSYMLDYENHANPQLERKYIIQKWKNLSMIDTNETTEILDKAHLLLEHGIKVKDALHIACAINMRCDFFLTTDDGIKKKSSYIQEIKILNPIGLINVIEKL